MMIGESSTAAETYRVPRPVRAVMVGLAGWIVAAALLLGLLQWLDLEVGSFDGSARALALALGFVLGTATLLFHAAVTSLRHPHALGGMMIGIAIFLLPVVGGLVAPTFLLDTSRSAALHAGGYVRWVLETTPLALLGFCALASGLPGGDRAPLWSRLRTELLLLPILTYVLLA